MKSNDKEILVRFDDFSMLTYKEHRGRLKSLAVSDDGIIIAGFERISSDGTETGLGMVQVLDTKDLSNPLDEEVWLSGFGTGVDITPDSSMVAIGSPEESTVYIFHLVEGTLPPSSEKIKHHDPRSKSFGWKVALSEDGKSIAVADPYSSVNNVESGAIFVYAWIEGDGWVDVQEILYGRNDMRKLGLAGVAIDDRRGRVDASDHNNHLYSFVVSEYDLMLLLLTLYLGSFSQDFSFIAV